MSTRPETCCGGVNTRKKRKDTRGQSPFVRKLHHIGPDRKRVWTRLGQVFGNLYGTTVGPGHA